MRSVMMLGWLVVLGAGCLRPPVVATDGSEGSSGGTEGDTGVGVDPGGSETGEPELVCGNGIVEAGEECDDAGESATCDADCSMAECGDGLVNAAAGEECDGEDLAGATCEALGFDVGTLACGAECGHDVSECGMPLLQLSFSQVKRFDFSWAATAGAEYYQLLESPAPGEPYAQLGGDIVGESVSFEMPLHLRWQASYVLRACNEEGCTDSPAVDVMGSLVDSIGYVKASNSGEDDVFGRSVVLSRDGNTLAVGAAGAVCVFVRDGVGTWSQQAHVQASNPGAGDGFGSSVALSGDGNTLAVGVSAAAVYVFVGDGEGTWSQQAYVQASNPGVGDGFGSSVALSGDGNTLAVGASFEDSSATGIDGDQADDSAVDSGAAYVFVRDGEGTWSQQAYVKASNGDAVDTFGSSAALSEDGNTLAVGALNQDIGGCWDHGCPAGSGAVYVFVRDGEGTWSQQAYVKASNPGASDWFGESVTLSEDGNTLAVGARLEDSSATGIDGDQDEDSAFAAGAVYVFVRDAMGGWSQQAYVKASNTGAGDLFGDSVTLSEDGNTLAVGARFEDSSATGIDGDQDEDSASAAGAVYVFVRDGMGTWSQQAYVKASNTGSSDWFGESVALSGDGNTLAVGAQGEDGSTAGIGGNQADDSAESAGAVYLY